MKKVASCKINYLYIILIKIFGPAAVHEPHINYCVVYTVYLLNCAA